MQKHRHDPKTFIIYKASFEGGGTWGIQQAVTLAFIEELTGRPIATWFDAFEGSSVGALIAATLTMRDDVTPDKPKYSAKELAQGFYPVALSLFDGNQRLLARQVFNQVTERVFKKRYLQAHLDSKTLEKALSAFFGKARVGWALKTLIMPAHSMDEKKTVYFGHIDDSQFAEEALYTAKMVRANPTLLTAVMASAAIPGLFPMHYDKSTDSHYTDIASHMTPLGTYKDLLNMARIRQRQLKFEQYKIPSRRDRLKLAGQKAIKKALPARLIKRFAKSAAQKPAPKTLTNTDNVIMRNVVFAAGDTSGLPFDRVNQPGAGIFAHLAPHQSYGFLNAARAHIRQIQEAILSDEHDNEVRAATGKKALTVITCRVTPEKNETAADYPSLNQMDGSHENLMKLYRFAAKYVLTNLDTIRATLAEIATEHVQRGLIDDSEYARLKSVLDSVTAEKAKKLLDTIIVTEDNAQATLDAPTPYTAYLKARSAQITDKQIIPWPNPMV